MQITVVAAVNLKISVEVCPFNRFFLSVSPICIKISDLSTKAHLEQKINRQIDINQFFLKIVKIYLETMGDRCAIKSGRSA